ncbi:MAG: helix-turn-helix domain-containing protein [Prevotella sp.]
MSEKSTSLDLELAARKDVCCSEGSINAFPKVFNDLFFMEDYIGLIACERGQFDFVVGHDRFTVHNGQTALIFKDTFLKILNTSADLKVHLLFYRVDPLRALIGHSVQSMRLHSLVSPSPCTIWNNGTQLSFSKYAELLKECNGSGNDTFADSERKLLLLALTYRLCNIFSQFMTVNHVEPGRKADTFIALIRLIGRHYTEQRKTEFYADKLCLSPRYLSELSKSMCGYTVQQLVFKAILRRSIFLIKNTDLSITEISDFFHFPNASAFGTFFRKQTGLSPRNYREADT